jgi:hypothetical protein
MQSFSTEAWRGANNNQLSEPLRYMAQRLPELLDPHAHFGRSASFKLDPVTALQEIIRLASAYATTNGRNPSTEVITDALRNTKDLLTAEAHLANWFAPERTEAIAGLAACTDFAQAKANGQTATSWLRHELPNVARGPLLSLRKALEDPSGGYRHRLLSHIEDRAKAGLSTDSDWRAFDVDLQNLAALLLADGRSGFAMGSLIARKIARAGYTETALAQLRESCVQERQSYVVAFYFPGVKQPKNLAAFGCQRVKQDDIRWGPESPRAADAALTEFAADRDCTLLTEVEAFDFEQAQTIAFDAAERLADQYGAQHRTYTIDVSPEMLLLRVSDNLTKRMETVPRRVPFPRALLRAPNEALEQSFRYAALSRSERSPIVQILHSWIALEALASEPTTPQRPYRFLQNRLSPILSLQAVRHGIAGSWQVASRAGRRMENSARWQEVERWLGIKSQHRTLSDLNDWVALLRGPASRKAPTSLSEDAPVADAAAVFNEVVRGFPPFPRRTVEYWQWLLAKGPRLANWCATMEVQARTTINRIYVVRNFSVHKALTKSDGAGQLAHAAHNMVDAVYEVLPAWVQTGKATWRSLDGIRRRAHHVLRSWGRNRRPALINAENLTRPGGDGLT